MKIQVFLFLALLLAVSSRVDAQTKQADSLKLLIRNANDDSLKVNTLIDISGSLLRVDTKEALRYANEALALAEKLDFVRGQAYALKSIGMSYYFQGNYIETLLFWQQSLSAFQTIGDKLGIANMLNNLGAVNFNEGDDEKAIQYYLESLRVSEEIGDKLRIATALVNIGAVYYNKKGTHYMALEYYLKALPLSEELGDNDAIGTSAVNMGEIYLARGDDKSALIYFEKALEAYKASENGNVPYALNNIGKVYAIRRDFARAIEYQREAFQLAENQNAKLEMSQSLLGLASTYDMKGDFGSAINSYLKAKDIALEIGANYELKFAYEGLAALYQKVSDFENAYKYQTLFSSIKDTLYNAEMDKRLQALTLNFDLEKKQGEVDLLTKDKALQQLDLQRQKTIRNATSITGLLLLLLAIGLYNRYRFIRQTKKIIEDEKDRSEKLLLNILPYETAEELKQKGSATPKQYEMVSVLFTDFKGFTTIAEKLTPEQLVAELNQCFLQFDHIIDKHNLEKIKTIGDAYMCAGGIPVANTTNPADVVKAGLEIKAYMDRIKSEREANGQDYWELRIGIHTGKVIAGVVGKNKFAYDIWGDAVNTASRMESSGEPGKVNISGDTFELVKDQFNCVYRGKIKAKNKGDIDMYFVEA
ncbi:MAG: adenylate/guanylate cyclase domain-containing protein [Bacteroidetes bacterium HGW-Bacteroidetes-11]|jgi:class 3 adenylate cyclase|nr:MAG: adenylate/guanylate cyclase domain-containing protein [Bacteroidetes bacterium HGW-Bacteroidetes-11]